MNGFNAIIIDGKVYEVASEIEVRSCFGCALASLPRCRLSDICIKRHCIFRYSQELTDKLNKA